MHGLACPVHVYVYVPAVVHSFLCTLSLLFTWYMLSTLHAYYVHIMYTYWAGMVSGGGGSQKKPRAVITAVFIFLLLPVPSTGALQVGHFRLGLG